MLLQRHTVKRIILLIIMVIILTINIPIYAEEISIDAKAYILYYPQENLVIVEKNSDDRRSPASTTKVMTALIAAKDHAKDEILTAHSTAMQGIDSDYVIAGIKDGEELTLNELLHFLLITSANESANIIAENISKQGTISNFVNMMNEEVKSLNLKNTNFTNTYGKTDINHYSSARDLAYIAAEAMNYSIFRDVVRKDSCPLPTTNLRSPDEWNLTSLVSTNKLLGTRSDYFNRVTGIKTGFTEQAGYCLVSSAINKDGLELISVILGAKDYDTLFGESKRLLEYGFKNYSYQTIIKAGSFVEKVNVVDAQDEAQVEILVDGELSYFLPVDKTKWNIDRIEYKELPLQAPVQKGDIIGSYEFISLDTNKSLGKVNLVTSSDIEKSINAQIRDEIMNFFNDGSIVKTAIIIGGVLFAFILLRIILKITSRQINKKKKSKRSSRKNNYRIDNYR